MLKLLVPQNYKKMWAEIDRYRSMGAVIGDNCRIWGNIDIINPRLVTIGNRVCLAEGSQVITHCPVNPGRVLIESDCWIGFRSVILPNVKIGYGSLIGAGSVVTKDIPAMSIAAGNPARVIRHRDTKELKTTAALMETFEAVGRL